jgi:AAA family ATP:ADP antiporter
MQTKTFWQSLGWRIARIEPHELGAAFAAFAFIFLVFGAYQLLRPVREVMGITSGVANLPTLFWAVLAAMLLVQPLFGWLTSRFRRSVFLPWVYLFFMINLAAFYAWFYVQEDHTWIARAFFVWMGVFGLFVGSVFWSFMADIFKPEQAGRLYGFLVGGMSAGGLVGPAIAAMLAPTIGTLNLLLIAIAFLGASLVAIRYLTRWHEREEQRAAVQTGTSSILRANVDRPVGGSIWAGFTLVLKQPHLVLIALFVLLLTWASTFVYLQQQELVAAAIPDRDRQTQLFGTIDFTVQSVSLVTQLFLFSRLSSMVRFRFLLTLVPLVMIGGYVVLATLPTVFVAVGIMGTRRVLEYSIVRPAREILYSPLDRETKYKAKNFIDTVIYRSGDAISGSIRQILGWLGVGGSGIAWFGAAMCAAWALVAYRLGTRHEEIVAGQESRAPAQGMEPQRTAG